MRMNHSRKPGTLDSEYLKTIKTAPLGHTYSICCRWGRQTTANSEFRTESRNKELSVFCCSMQVAGKVAGKEQQIISFSAISVFFFTCNTSLLLLVVVDQLQPFLRHNDKEKKRARWGTSTAVVTYWNLYVKNWQTRRPAGRQNNEPENSSSDLSEQKVLPEETASPHTTPPSIRRVPVLGVAKMVTRAKKIVWISSLLTRAIAWDRPLGVSFYIEVFSFTTWPFKFIS